MEHCSNTNTVFHFSIKPLLGRCPQLTSLEEKNPTAVKRGILSAHSGIKMKLCRAFALLEQTKILTEFLNSTFVAYPLCYDNTPRFVTKRHF
jgi:hypothetical protein